MNQAVDLRQILNNWPYDPDDDARFVKGDDGREILQVRTPLGVEQYELEGRPDGARPHNKESMLEFQLKRLEDLKKSGGEEQFGLEPHECSELFNEGTLYYFRYIRLFQLKDWSRTVRDTTRNLLVFDLVHRYARREEDQQFLEKWRPYILRVNASASAMLEVEKGAYDQALRIAKDGLEKLENLEEVDDDTFKFERARSATALRELAAQIEKNRPLSELEKLENQLRRAIDQQEFERAAQLRDRIRALRNQTIC